MEKFELQVVQLTRRAPEPQFYVRAKEWTPRHSGFYFQSGRAELSESWPTWFKTEDEARAAVNAMPCFKLVPELDVWSHAIEDGR